MPDVQGKGQADMTDPQLQARRRLDRAGWSRSEVERRVVEMAAADQQVLDQVRFSRRFFGGPVPFDVAQKTYGAFAQATRAALYPGLPGPQSIALMQREVIEHALELMRAPGDASGLITSGGTESVIMAAKAAVTRAAARGIARHEMEIVAARSAHPCIDKAAELLGVRLRRVPVGQDWRADPKLMAEAISPRSVMLYASYPSYAYGLADDIVALGALAGAHGLWLHVDACMSGLLAPFLCLSGESLPAFDFAVDAVCSISADLHKHGYSAKGASLVLFRSEELAAWAPFEYADHPLPPMRTPTLAGTAAGAPIASAWAVMKYLGVQGYMALAADLARTRRAFESAIRGVPGFEILGEPLFSLLVVTSGVHDMVRVRAELGARRWFTLPVVDPPGIHINLGALDEPLAQLFARDLAYCPENSH